MKRIIIICEGETEQTFCRTTLGPYLNERGIEINWPIIKRSRGGIVRWNYLKDQIERHLKEDTYAGVTTLIDYYGLYKKHDFPNWDTAELIADKNQRMSTIENGMKADVSSDINYRFIPYIQLHEFEGLLFNEKNIFYEQIPNKDIVDPAYLDETFDSFLNPEMINNSRETSPSHRLERIIKGYNKIVYGDILSEAIGMQRLIDKSPRFRVWVESLGAF